MTKGERIKERRSAKGMTQKAVAEAIGVAPNTVQRFEYGTVSPSVDTYIALATCLDCSLDYLVGLSEDPTRH